MLIFRNFMNIEIVVQITPSNTITPQKREEIDEIFEKTLRPIQSRNARNIYMVLRDSETEYLTTYDMQLILEEQGNKLSKVELNNWLSALQDAGLVRKASKRGKPTSRPYTRRYTFDLWKLSQKGREISYKIEILRRKSPIQIVEKIVKKTIEKKVIVSKLPPLEETSFKDQEKLQNLSINVTLLKTLKEKQESDLRNISEQTGFTPEKIIQFIEDQGKKRPFPLYFLNENPTDLRGKILQTIGINPRKEYFISLSPEGKKIISKLSS
jgi:DNA-binding transcriptional ArsR family regulator